MNRDTTTSPIHTESNNDRNNTTNNNNSNSNTPTTTTMSSTPKKNNDTPKKKMNMNTNIYNTHNTTNNNNTSHNSQPTIPTLVTALSYDGQEMIFTCSSSSRTSSSNNNNNSHENKNNTIVAILSRHNLILQELALENDILDVYHNTDHTNKDGSVSNGSGNSGNNGNNGNGGGYGGGHRKGSQQKRASAFYQRLGRTSAANNLYDIRISPTLSPRYSRWRSSFSLYNPFLWGDQLSYSFFGRSFFNNKICCSDPLIGRLESPVLSSINNFANSYDNKPFSITNYIVL